MTPASCRCAAVRRASFGIGRRSAREPGSSRGPAVRRRRSALSVGGGAGRGVVGVGRVIRQQHRYRLLAVASLGTYRHRHTPPAASVAFNCIRDLSVDKMSSTLYDLRTYYSTERSPWQPRLFASVICRSRRVPEAIFGTSGCRRRPADGTIRFFECDFLLDPHCLLRPGLLPPMCIIPLFSIFTRILPKFGSC